MASSHTEADSGLTLRRRQSSAGPADGGSAEHVDEDDEDGKPVHPTLVKKDLTPFAPLDIPLKYRWVALVTILFYTTGAAFAESTLGPLKSTFVRELKINSECNPAFYVVILWLACAIGRVLSAEEAQHMGCHAANACTLDACT